MELSLTILLISLLCAPGLLVFVVFSQSYEGRPAAGERQDVTNTPRFFARPSPHDSTSHNVDEAVVARFEEYVKGEQARAAEFVSEPSIESLYRYADRGIRLN